MAFALNLLGTLSSSGVIMRYPAIFLVGGVASLFAGFLCGIILYYGLGVAATIIVFVGGGFLFYEVRVSALTWNSCPRVLTISLRAISTLQCYWAKGHSDTYNAVNLALGALFFRSCLPDLAQLTETHPHLNPPPLAPREERMEKGEAATPEKSGKDEL